MELTIRENPNTMSAEQIRATLPHRYPFLLIDTVEDYEPGKWAICHKNVSNAEPVFSGHFPEYPIFPGVLQLEALAQCGAIALLSLPENKGKLPLFGGVKNARFKKPVLPGDIVELSCQLIRQHGPLGIAEAKATVKGKTVCVAELSFAIIEK
ncbi:MAG: 3-hydroxyacyl-ACP dehydratase FabZ [Lachnospiraceae bacterium]|nr:3-hydroxyacyl-ACP dehydratase FabZ [Lachnospiraceae bacterium]MBQ2576952.1 3-hydroxyacyl-ACP dehydratase FabZ [Lachnospiraceae bacterium]MCR4732606.1 3-hydroxyacyl-ACP dehydratase FabZ [Lachnospiraceae bacterium]MEE3355748.1 3-hydroxyacyl-ACP dehydratase FabZ [Candidatus Weimeria sp.]